MGSPMVFQTAPPHPASKARMICSPQLVGGPEASQNGFGEWMPAKFVVRSGMAGNRGCVFNARRGGEQRGVLQHCEGRSFAVGYRVDYFAAAVDEIAAGEVFFVVY